MHVEETYAFACPYCWQSTAIQLEMPHGVIELVEDCQVCCNPIEITIRARHGEVIDFQASPANSLLE